MELHELLGGTRLPALRAPGRRAANPRSGAGCTAATAKQFERTGARWEFYHPQGGAPTALERKPFNSATGRNLPSRDYLGHTPLFAMAELWRRAESRAKKVSDA